MPDNPNPILTYPQILEQALTLSFHQNVLKDNMIESLQRQLTDRDRRIQQLETELAKLTPPQPIPYEPPIKLPTPL